MSRYKLAADQVLERQVFLVVGVLWAPYLPAGPGPERTDSCV
jgi:hypothetical protein